MKCPSCGTENDARMKFCGECTAALHPTEAPPRDTPRGRGTDSGAADGERKLVTILFADISGFTTLAETLDPEPLRDLINACFGLLVPCVERYGGTVDKFIGDEIMTLFGAPVAHDNDPERAVRAALDMRSSLGAFNIERGTALEAHFAVNTGLVLAGAVGAGSRTEYSVMGDAVNVASRLAETAAPGEILVGPDTHRRAGHLFACEEAGPVRIRGRVEPLTVYRVLGARTSAEPAATRAGRWVGSPLVGREREKEAFVAAIDRVLQGEGGILAVVGDAGLGKSRLTAEVRRLAGPELTWLEGRTLSFGQQLSHLPFLELMQGAAGIEVDDSDEERAEKLGRLVTGLLGEEGRDVLPYLATLLSVPVPEELQDKVRYLDGEAMGRQLFRSMRVFFSGLARRRPLVLVFEDVHWLDASSVGLLEHLLPLVSEEPLLVCLVGRPEQDSPTARLLLVARTEYRDRYVEIHLSPLSRDESHTLVRNLVGLRNLPTGFREGIERKAEGNPFFIEEVVRALIDLGGLIPTEDGAWRLTERAREIPIPDTVQGVIMARIDRLDDELKSLLRLAAVIGRSFFYRVLRSLAEAERRVDEDIAMLESLEFVRERARDPELEYIFKHALVQEATYESMLLQRRRELHLQVARVIEELFADRLDEFYALLAYHYTKGEDWEKAREYLLKAGDQAGSISANAEALAHYERAAEAHLRVFGDKWEPLERASLERKMGEAFFRNGDYARAQEYFHRAMGYLGLVIPPSDALRRALLREVAKQALNRVRPPWLRRRRGNDDAGLRVAQELARIMKSLAWVTVVFDPPRALFERLLVLNLCEQAGFTRGVSVGFGGLGFALDLVPAPRLAHFYVRRSLELAEGLRQEDALAFAHWRIGCHEAFHGDWEEARRHYLAAADTHGRLGNIHEWGAAYYMSTDLLLERGEWEAALPPYREVARRGEESGDPAVRAWGLMTVAEVLFRQGKLDDLAERDLRAADVILREAMDFFNGSRAGGLLGHHLLRQGRVTEALQVLENHRSRIVEHQLKSYWCRNVWTGLAQAKLLLAEEALPLGRDSALDEAEEACRAVFQQAKVDRGALVAAHRLEGTWHWLGGSKRKAERSWRRAVDMAESLSWRYEEALARLEIGRRTGDRTELQRAEAMFAEMGAAFDLAQTRRLLEGP